MDQYDADWIANKVLDFEPLTFLGASQLYEYIDTEIYNGRHINKINSIFIEHGISGQTMVDYLDSFNWIETPIDTGISKNNKKIEINLPFSFTFYGVTYDSIYIFLNGYVSFIDSSYNGILYGLPIPSSYEPNALISVYGNIFGFPSDDESKVAYLSAEDKFVVSWSLHNSYDTCKMEEFQVIIEENSIIFQYREIYPLMKTFSCIGIENEEGTIGTSCNGDFIDNNIGIVFSRDVHF